MAWRKAITLVVSLTNRFKRGVGTSTPSSAPDEAQEKPETGEDEAGVVIDGREDDICGVAFATLEEAATDVSVGLHVPDDGFDGGATP